MSESQKRLCDKPVRKSIRKSVRKPAICLPPTRMISEPKLPICLTPTRMTDEPKLPICLTPTRMTDEPKLPICLHPTSMTYEPKLPICLPPTTMTEAQKLADFFLDDWEVRQYFRNIAGFPMLFFRGKLNTWNKSNLLKTHWYSSYAESFDRFGRVMTRDGTVIALGAPKKEFVEQMNGFDIGRGMTQTDLSVFFEEKCWKMFRHHPHMLSLWTTQQMPTDIYLETERLLKEEKAGLLANDEKEFLRSVRNSHESVGEWSYKDGIWFYRDKFAFNERAF